MASSRVDHLSQRGGMPPCRNEGHWQGGMIETSLLWEESIPHYGLKGMGYNQWRPYRSLHHCVSGAKID